jgi:hypothetical protein
MPPLWVFTPPVALNIACSQARPTGLIARSVCGPARRAVSLPTLKNGEPRGNGRDTGHKQRVIHIAMRPAVDAIYQTQFRGQANFTVQGLGRQLREGC